MIEGLKLTAFLTVAFLLLSALGKAAAVDDDDVMNLSDVRDDASDWETMSNEETSEMIKSVVRQALEADERDKRLPRFGRSAFLEKEEKEDDRDKRLPRMGKRLPRFGKRLPRFGRSVEKEENKRDKRLPRMGKRLSEDSNIQEETNGSHMERDDRAAPFPRLGRASPFPRLGRASPFPRLGRTYGLEERAAPFPRLGRSSQDTGMDMSDLPRIGKRGSPTYRLG